jgi:DNA-binding transcriptional MerR regulator
MNGNFIKKLSLIIIFCLLLSQPLLAQSKETIFASYKYTLGDSDTKSDAKKIAFIEAKRLCLEKAGSYIESKTEVSDFRLSKDEIKTYTGGILKVEIISEEFKAIGENLTLFMKVKAEIDLEEVKESLKRVKEDKKFAEKIKDQEKQLEELEDKIRKLQHQLSSNDFEQTAKVRQERKEVFSKIDELERIKSEIKSKTNLAVENVELGMTSDEVVKLIGKPRSTTAYIYFGSHSQGYNYGNVWIIFEHGIVSCIVKSNYFGNRSDCNKYRTHMRDALIK